MSPFVERMLSNKKLSAALKCDVKFTELNNSNFLKGCVMIKLNHLINDYWHFCAHSSELSKPGDYIKFSFFDEEVVIYNDGSGIIAFDNICPHRGAKFFKEKSGCSMAICKYHGLTIANGQVHVPAKEIYQNCIFDYNKYKVDFCGSLVFFAINPKFTLYDQLSGTVYDLIESISFDCQKLVDINQYDYQCNALIAIENALEPDHLPFIHPNTLDTLNLINCKNEFYNENSIAKFDIGSIRLKKALDRVSKLFDTGHHRFDGYITIHIFPFGFISSTYGISYSIQNFFPLSNEKTSFISKLYFSGLVNGVTFDQISSFIDSTIKTNRKVFEEDHDICNRISFKSYLNLIDGPLSTNEVKIKRFRERILNL
jgi:nitrite reductase/ring-hydroxylating ferredoxin subunit